MAKLSEAILKVRAALEQKGELSYAEFLELVGSSASPANMAQLRREFAFKVRKADTGEIVHTVAPRS